MIKNIPKDENGLGILFAYSNCEVTKYSTYFDIEVNRHSGYNGCGHAEMIDEVFKLCANECKTCKKIDNVCVPIIGHPSSRIVCNPLPCVQKGGSCAMNRLCCSGLECLANDKCLDPKKDCTPCGRRIEPNKPCCDKSGIKANGICKCSSFTKDCKNDNDCPGRLRCIAQKCE